MNPRAAKMHLLHRVLPPIVGEVLGSHSLPQEWAFMQLNELLVIIPGHLSSWNRYGWHIACLWWYLILYAALVQAESMCDVIPVCLALWGSTQCLRGAVDVNCPLSSVKAPGEGRSGNGPVVLWYCQCISSIKHNLLMIWVYLFFFLFCFKL